MSNLRLINETEITSSVASVNITDVFTTDFDIYKITTNDISTVGTVAININLRFINSSGSVISSSDYDYAVLRCASSVAFSELKSTTATNFTYFGGKADQSAETNGSVGYIFNPTNTSSYTFGLYQNSTFANSTNENHKGIGVLTSTANITGFQIYFDNQNVNSGFIRTYGLRVDS